MSAHAKFSPSSAHRWIPCPGSIALAATIPEGGSSDYADEGSAAHILAARALDHGKEAAFYIGEEIQPHPKSKVYTVTPDMALHVQTYLDEVRSRVGPGDTLLVEQKLDFSEAIGVPKQFGTGDAIILHATGKRLTMMDLKYGQGVRVFAEDNEQMLTYGLGTLETFGAVLDEEPETVNLVVVQPRLDHIDEWECSTERLAKHREQIRVSARHAQVALDCPDPDAIPLELFTPTDKGCRFCPAKVKCKALERMVASTVFDDFEALDDPATVAVVGQPPVPKQNKLGLTFGVLDIIETWCRAVRAEVERQVAGGMTVIGPDGLPMKLIEGRKGHRAWADPKAAEGVLTGLLPPEKAFTAPALITPAAAAKLLDKKATKAQWNDMVAPLIFQPPGKAKVTLGSDPSPPFTGQASADEFADLDEE